MRTTIYKGFEIWRACNGKYAVSIANSGAIVRYTRTIIEAKQRIDEQTI